MKFTLKTVSKKLLTREYVILLISIVLFIFFSFTAKGFFNIFTITNIFRQSSALAFAGIGMTLIILLGKIDLSVGSAIALSSMITASFMEEIANSGTILIGISGFLIIIICSCLISVFNGILVGYFKIDSFIVTLAMMSMARGLTLAVSDSSRILVQNSLFNSIASLDILGIPFVLLFVIVVYIISNLILQKTKFGRYTYAVGDNENTALALGINSKSHIVKTYMVAGVFYAIAAIIITGRSRSAQPMAGLGMEFDVITAVVIGGVSLLGGVGNLKNTCLGVILVSIISTGLGMLNVSPFVIYIIKGVLILLAVLSNQYKIKNKKSESYISHLIHNKQTHDAIKKIQNNTQKILSLKSIYKSFAGVKALQGVSLDIERGKVHAIVGENGAGKSTLMKILSGVYEKDSGDIFVDDIPISIDSPSISHQLGISIIFQELSSIRELNVNQNIHLGKEKSILKFFLDTKNMIADTIKLLLNFNLKIDVTKKISLYTVGQQQLVEIIKAIKSNSWVVIMDEPTSAISEEDKNNLFNTINDLKKADIAIVYISHRMTEIFEIADTISVLRDGEHIITKAKDEINESELIKYMVGRELAENMFIKTNRDTFEKKMILEIKGLSRENVFEDINFQLFKGEVLGFFGLMGAGRTEIMRAIFGLDKANSGEIRIADSEKLTRSIMSTKKSIQNGIAYISENRREEGIIPNMNVKENLSLLRLPYISKFGWINRAEEGTLAERFISEMQIKTPSELQSIKYLSGGNQQKVCIARWLAIAPKIIIMDEPTRGIDVGAKSEIYKLIDILIQDGHSIILISSEMPELLGLSDRIITIANGRKTAELKVDEDLTQEILLSYSAAH